MCKCRLKYLSLKCCCLLFRTDHTCCKNEYLHGAQREPKHKSLCCPTTSWMIFIAPHLCLMLPQATSLLKRWHGILHTVTYYLLVLFLITCEDRKKKAAAGQKLLVPRVSLRFVCRLSREAAPVDLLVVSQMPVSYSMKTATFELQTLCQKCYLFRIFNGLLRRALFQSTAELLYPSCAEYGR